MWTTAESALDFLQSTKYFFPTNWKPGIQWIAAMFLPGIKRLEIEAVRIRLLQGLEMHGVILSLHHSRREKGEIYHVETAVHCYF